MKVTFCGNGAGASYDHDRGGSCVMLERNQLVTLIDCGPGAVRRIAQSGIQWGAIKAILITHLHYDHALGLADLFNRFGRMGTDSPRILGPTGIAEYVETCKRLITVSTASGLLPPHLENLKGEYAAPGEQLEVAGLVADAIVVPHNSNVEAYSWRVQADGLKVVVSGDLKTDESFMVPFASEADLLVHEAYSTEGLEEMIKNFPTDFGRERARSGFSPTHSEVSVVARIAAEAKVKRLALTHLVPPEDEDLLVGRARVQFDGEVMIATPGTSVQLD